MKSRWKKYLLYSGVVIVGGGLLIYIISLGYSFSWTGFGKYTPTNLGEIPSKTLWDWMQLLIIPLVLAVGAFYLNRAERQTESEIAKDRQQEAALQAYLDRMSELLVEKKLRTTEEIEVRDVARTRTISIMRVLNKERKDLVIQFLREAKVITDENSILNGADMEGMDLQGLDFYRVFLQGTNLSRAHLEGAYLGKANLHAAYLINTHLKGALLKDANLNETHLDEANLDGADLRWANLERAKLFKVHLQDAHLEGANLERANLVGAHLDKVHLQDANLEGADLSGASLERAELYGVNLEQANLRNTHLKGANLKNAILTGANLLNAKVMDEQLASTKSLEGATMPDGTIHK